MIASDLLNREVEGLDTPAYEWVVVLSFYCAVRSINAFLFAHVDQMPRTHAQRARAINQSESITGILDEHTRLENLSRDARYTAAPGAFDRSIALNAHDTAFEIHEHIRSLI